MDLGMGSDEAWTEKGVRFEVVKEEKMIEAVLEHLSNDFFPDESVFRSLGVDLSNGSMMYEYKTSLEQGHSIAAVNSEGKILGVRIGVILQRGGCDTCLTAKLLKLFNFIPCCLPQWMNTFQMLAKRLDFNTFEQFEKFGCDTIYEDKALCSARWHGFRGLGTELVRKTEALAKENGCTHTYTIVSLHRRTEALAKENGCTHTYAIVSSKYSTPIFDRLGHTMVKSLAYADFVDNRGELLLNDTREHPEVRVYAKAL